MNKDNEQLNERVPQELLDDTGEGQRATAPPEDPGCPRAMLLSCCHGRPTLSIIR